MLLLRPSADTLITLDGMTRADTGAYVNTASPTWQLKDAAGAVLASGALTYVAASNGIYQGTVPSTTSLTHGTIYYLEITVPGSPKDFRRIKCQAVYHEETP